MQKGFNNFQHPLIFKINEILFVDIKSIVIFASPNNNKT